MPNTKAFRLDMTMMFAIHDALRRELQHIARITASTTDDPNHIIRSAIGWQMFKTYLDDRTARILQNIPEPLRLAYRDQWRPAYADFDRWGATAEQPGS